MRGAKSPELVRESVAGWFRELTEQEQAALIAEFEQARAGDFILQALYPDEDSLPVVWLSQHWRAATGESPGRAATGHQLPASGSKAA